MLRNDAKPGKNTQNIEEARLLLGQCVLFRNMSPTQRKLLLRHVKIERYANAEVIFRRGDTGGDLMALLDGSVRIGVTSPEGKELVLAILGPGDIFGEIALLDGGERSADAIAAESCTLATLKRTDVLSFLGENPSAWADLVKVLCDRLRRTDELLTEIALLQVPTRLAKAILRIAKPGANTGDTSKQTTLSQRELATLIGATRESVNKCLGGWQRAHVIDVNEGIITIRDDVALQRLAEFTIDTK